MRTSSNLQKPPSPQFLQARQVRQADLDGATIIPRHLDSFGVTPPRRTHPYFVHSGWHTPGPGFPSSPAHTPAPATTASSSRQQSP